MNAGVVAEDVAGHASSPAGQKREIETRLEFGEESLGGPAFFHEEVLEAGAIAALAQALLVAEDFSDGANYGDGLMRQQEGVEAHGEMRLVGEAAADAQRVADLAVACGGREADVVDLGIGAPRGAAGGGDLEFARQVVELGIGGEQLRDFDGDGRGVDELHRRRFRRAGSR